MCYLCVWLGVLIGTLLKCGCYRCGPLSLSLSSSLSLSLISFPSTLTHSKSGIELTTCTVHTHTQAEAHASVSPHAVTMTHAKSPDRNQLQFHYTHTHTHLYFVSYSPTRLQNSSDAAVFSTLIAPVFSKTLKTEVRFFFLAGQILCITALHEFLENDSIN